MAKLRRRRVTLTLERIEAVAQSEANSLGVAERAANHSAAEGLERFDSDLRDVEHAQGKLEGVTYLAYKIGFDCRCPVIQRNATARRCKCTKMRKLPPLK